MNSMAPIEVLIVEDDLRIAEIQKKFIEKIEGFEVIGIAATNQEAIMYLEVYKPSLILLDVYFPDMNGLQFLKETKQREIHVDVIMITATKELDKIKEAITIGVFDYIIKPVVFERFQQSLERFRKYHTDLLELNKSASSITQQEVDKLLLKQQERGQNLHLPKGIDPLTLEKAYEVTRQTQIGYTAEHIAEKMGVSRTTARRYLEHLVAEDKLVADLVYGTVGRPERVYKVRN